MVSIIDVDLARGLLCGWLLYAQQSPRCFLLLQHVSRDRKTTQIQAVITNVNIVLCLAHV